MDYENATFSDQLAVLANRLRFERHRALRVLAAIANEESGVVNEVESSLEWQQDTVGPRDKHQDARTLRRALARNVRESWYEDHLRTNADTSYLLVKEQNARFSLRDYLQAIADHYVRQLGLKLQLALIAHGLDKGAYPTSLDELVPDYLASVPIDPYAGKPFKYEPVGVPGRLKRRLEVLPPDTPFVWSVGRDNNQVVLEAATGIEEFGLESFHEKSSPDEVRNYRFVPAEGYWADDTALVFPLPPISSKKGTTSPADEPK